MALDAKTIQILGQALDEIDRKIQECRKNGHKEPFNLPYTWDSKSGLQAQGFCSYCNQYYRRDITQKERDEFEEFKKSMYEPTI